MANVTDDLRKAAGLGSAYGDRIGRPTPPPRVVVPASVASPVRERWAEGEAKSALVAKALMVAGSPNSIMELPPQDRMAVDELAKAIRTGASWTRPGMNSGSVSQIARARPVSAQVVAQAAGAALGPSSSITPVDIELAMRSQGLDWVEPFAPGKPLTPYYGYNRRPRERNYQVGRNTTTETRQGRIPYQTLNQLITSYDVAQICYRHAIQDLRSMRVRFEVMDGYGDNAVKEIAAAKEFWRRPDRQLDPITGKAIRGSGNTLRNWICKHATDVWRFDCGTMYRHRDRAGRLIALPIPDGTLFAPMLDYFGTNPVGQAPAFMQFIQGIPWDTMRLEDLIYEPMWPQTESPYGTPPIETILVNANTDMRLQTYFLQFFTTGQVPEAFAIAPEDQSDPDALADWQETYNDWTYGDQAERWGLRWLPNGTELEFYKPQQFDPDVAEYVMRRTVAAFMMVPHDLGFTADVNRSTGDTQMDTQFRINSLPHVGYYEDIMDAVTQEDLDLPVQCRFDTGREKEDRLMEAQAHQIYVSMAAESPDEVRDKVLGFPVNPEEKIPRFFDSSRLGPIPVSYLLGVAGDVDPLTGVPRPGTTQARDLVLPGTTGPDPEADSDETGSGPKPSGARPKAQIAPDPHPAPLLARPSAPSTESKPAVTNGPNPRRSAGAAGARRIDQGTASSRTLKAPTAGIGVGTGIAGVVWAGDPEPEDDEVKKALRAWRRQSRNRVAKGQTPRAFENSPIPPGALAYVWKGLDGATTREQVDAAFMVKATAGSHGKRSGMVSLDVPPGLIPVMEGGVPDQHITIVYFGKDVDDETFDAVCDMVEEVASAEAGPFAGTIGGLGTFPPSEGSDWLVPAFAVPQVAGIERLRAPLEDINASQHTDFHPHMTLAYLDPAEPLPEPVPMTPVVFTHLSVHRGDDVRRFRFGGAQKAAEYETPIVSGLALVSRATERAVMVQRGNKDDDSKDGARWEWPAGHIDEGESPLDAAVREWEEETDSEFPTEAELVGTWVSENGKFQGFVFRIDDEGAVELGTPDSEEISAIAWWGIDDVDHKMVRDKVRENLDRSEPILERATKAAFLPKSEVHYREATVQGENCQTCRYMTPQGGCQKVMGMVSPEDMCDLWEPRDAAKAAQPGAPRPGPGGHREALIVDHYTPEVQQALAQQVDPRAVATSFGNLAGSTIAAAPETVAGAGVTAALAAGFAATLHVASAALREVILRMWSDAWVAGSKDGRDSLDLAGLFVPAEDGLDKLLESIDWQAWSPGNAPRAEDIPGFDSVQSQITARVTGMVETTRDAIASVVEQFINERAPGPWTEADVNDLASQLGSVIDDPGRAQRIARTEVNRAMSEAALDIFARANETFFDLLPYPDACKKCKAIAKANPHPISDVSALPPIHTSCRCGVRPAAGL